nr:fumarylacetoacetate hydrolase family protein [Steroidobacteraceae bacterium]
VAQLSRQFQLEAGDLIFTGTPAGVGALQPGDRVIGQIADLPPVAIVVSGAQS